jgi:hypothetical protein
MAAVVHGIHAPAFDLSREAEDEYTVKRLSEVDHSGCLAELNHLLCWFKGEERCVSKGHATAYWSVAAAAAAAAYLEIDAEFEE